MSTTEAVGRDLAELAGRAPGLDQSALAAMALVMARELDSETTTATAKANCARVLADALEQLRALAPEKPEGDKVDDLNARRSKRRAAA